MPSETITCSDVQPHLAAYALGDAAPTAELLEHLATCAECQQTLQAYAQIARVLPYDASEQVPSPALRERVLAAVQESPRPPMLPRPVRRRFTPQRVAMTGMALLIVALLSWNIGLQQQLATQTTQASLGLTRWQMMARVLNASDLHWYTLSGSTASGHFWFSSNQQLVCVVAQNLPDLGPNQVYQLWLIKGNEQDNGGIFPALNGNGWVLLKTNEPPESYTHIAITIEPRGGSTVPDGQHVLDGSAPAGLLPQHVD